LTSAGPKVLEFNCRFGDPETQVILPLLVNDLVDIMDACTRNVLDQMDIRWKDLSCACVVATSKGYPQSSSSGDPISGLDNAKANAMIFHAGISQKGKDLVTAGGRVLGVTAWGASLRLALDAAYQLIEQIQFDGIHFRHDIGARALKDGDSPDRSAYAQSGVDIDAGNRAVSLMSNAVRSTYTPAVLAGIGAFGGLFDASSLQKMKRPVLVASTDGVGTKVKIAAQANRFYSVGQDIVNHCINDILVQGAKPLFFLDYFATSRLKPEMTAEIVSGISAACKAAGCVLLGGETAEMPGVYSMNEFDVAGTIVGVVEYDQILPRKDILPGDLLVGLPSSGPHTNGYSLIRRIFGDTSLDTVFPELGTPLVNLLLAPHRSYLSWLQPALEQAASPVKALAHITGGGFIENIPRVLPESTGAAIRWGSWTIPPLYRVIQSRGKINWLEMARVFNLGIGMVAVVAPDELDRFMKLLPERAEVIGEIVSGERKVTFL
jgi:phosphoribosylamine--glycine ligase / phosphoribosylformylglycinamidine cyclo-ligase